MLILRLAPICGAYKRLVIIGYLHRIPSSSAMT